MNVELTATNTIFFYTNTSGVTRELAKYSASPRFVLPTSSVGSLLVTMVETGRYSQRRAWAPPCEAATERLLVAGGKYTQPSLNA